MLAVEPRVNPCPRDLICSAHFYKLPGPFRIQYKRRSTAISRLSSHPFKFASQLSSQKISKISGFNFFTNLLVFAVSQTWQHNLSWKKLNKQQYGANVHELNKSGMVRWCMLCSLLRFAFKITCLKGITYLSSLKPPDRRSKVFLFHLFRHQIRTLMNNFSLPPDLSNSSLTSFVLPCDASLALRSCLAQLRDYFQFLWLDQTLGFTWYYMWIV